jgi:hypothetical protein
MKTPRRAPPAPERKRRVWPWVLGVLAIVAIVWSSYARVSREGRERRYAQAQHDSSRRADSVRKVDSARADSVSNAALVGGMVDSTKTPEQARKDSIANLGRVLRDGVVAAIRSYTNAIQRGDLSAARAAFPRVPEEELTRWQSALERNEIRIRVEPPRQVILSMSDLVADADVALIVQYVDRTTKERTTTRLARHATLTKQRQSWQLDVLKPR